MPQAASVTAPIRRRSHEIVLFKPDTFQGVRGEGFSRLLHFYVKEVSCHFTFFFLSYVCRLNVTY